MKATRSYKCRYVEGLGWVPVPRFPWMQVARGAACGLALVAVVAATWVRLCLDIELLHGIHDVARTNAELVAEMRELHASVVRAHGMSL